MSIRSLFSRRRNRAPAARHHTPAAPAPHLTDPSLEPLEPRTLLASTPIVRVNIADASAAEFPRDIAEFRIRRTGAIDEPLTVRYLLGGTAQNGVDYTPLSTSFTIPAGRRNATLPIIPIDDLTVEGGEVVVLTLLDDDAYDLDPTGRARSAAITIKDDDTVPVVTIHRPDRRAHEIGEQPARFVIRRTGALDLPLTVSYRISGSARNGVDYLTIPQTATIRAGRDRVAIYIRPVNDAEFEGNETVRLTLQPDPKFTLKQTAPGEVSTFITIHDRPLVTITVADPTATTDPSDTAAFLVSRTGPTNAALRIAYTLGGTATAGTDYVRPPNLIRIPKGQSSVLVTIRGRGTQFDSQFKTIRLTITGLAQYNIDLSNPESYSRYLRIWDDTKGGSFPI